MSGSHILLVMILATEGKEFTEWKSNESWFGAAGQQKCPSQGKMAWSASVPVKWSVLGKIPWHWSIIIYSSNVFWHDFGPFWQALSLNHSWTWFGSWSPGATPAGSLHTDTLFQSLKQFVRKDKRCPVPVILLAWRYLWIHLICWCRCSPRESCSHMWKTE